MNGIEVIRVWTMLAANRGTFRRILNYLSYLASSLIGSAGLDRPDLIIATSPQFFCGWAGILAGKLRRIPVVLEIRDIWPDSIRAVGAIRNKLILYILERLESRMYRAADMIVTVGDGYRDVLLKKGVPLEKLRVIPNGIDNELFSPHEPKPNVRKYLGLEKKLICSYIGTIGMACGLDIVIEAARQLNSAGRNDIAFLLVGDGADKKRLEEAVKAQGLTGIVFTGMVEREKVPELLAASDVVLVHLRKTELFTTVIPSKIFEAAGMAKPIICGVAGKAAELIEQSKGGINITPENADELVLALKRLSDNPRKGEEMGRIGYEYISRHFNREYLAQEYLNLLRGIIRES